MDCVAPGIAELLSTTASPVDCGAISVGPDTCPDAASLAVSMEPLEPPTTRPRTLEASGSFMFNAAAERASFRRCLAQWPHSANSSHHASFDASNRSQQQQQLPPPPSAVRDDSADAVVRGMVSRLRRRIRSAHLTASALHRQDELYWAERSATTP